jgi:mannose-6-phosphate isomerase-like protein (cupin superfamily)
MLIKDLENCAEITAGDKSLLRELLNPHKDDVNINYSLALARVKQGEVTRLHKLKGSEVYYILAGEGEIHIDAEKSAVKAGQAVYIPPGAVQAITNTGTDELVFICIVDPAWQPKSEDILDD